MSVARTLVLVPLVAAIALAGCRARTGGSDAERRGDSDRQSAEVQRLQDENAALQTRLKQAQEELEKGGGTVGGQAAAIGVEGLDGFTTNGHGGIALGEDFAFERGSSKLSAEGKKAIEKLALRLNDGDLANHLIIVEGHTDDQPVSRPDTIDRYTDNWGLSAARSASVVRALQKAGVKPERLNGSFRGQYAPAANAGKDKAQNRRVEIFLAK